MSTLKTYNLTDILEGIINVTKLNEEIEASSCISGFKNVTHNQKNDSIVIHGESITDETQLDQLIQNHKAKDLTDWKREKAAEIDMKTGQLISNGFSYKNKNFSLSANAQTNILALYTTKDHPALTYPIKYNTIDDSEQYDVTDSADLEGMYLTALATKKAHVDSGTALKDQIRSATTKEELDAIVDNR